MRNRPALLFPTDLLLMAAALLTCVPVLAQVVGREEKAQKKIEQRKDLERKTLGLLDEIILSAGAFKLPENRCFILANAADLLWDHDEKRARNLYWDALNNLTLLANELGKSPAANNSGNEKARNEDFYAIFGLRRDLLHKVARHDAQFALDLLQATRLQSLEQVKSDLATNSELQLEQEIAVEVAARDPRRALQMARESLAKGLSFQILNLLWQLNEKDSELAAKFAGEVVDKLKTENSTAAASNLVIAAELLLFSRPTKEVPAEEKDSTPTQYRRKPIKLDEGQRRDLVEVITSDALSASPNRGVISNLDEIVPEIEQFAPSRLPALRRKLTESNRTLSAEEKGWNEHNFLVVNGTSEEMLKAAAKASGDLRQSLEHEAIIKAAMGGNSESVREFINDKIEDEGRRKSLIDELDSELIGQAVYKNDLEALQNLLPKIRLKEERARAMAQIAISLEAKGKHDEALKLLDEAQLLIKVDFNSDTRTNALLELLVAYALVEPSRSFAIVERSIDRANEQLALALLASKLLRQNGILKRGEIVMARSGEMSDFLLFRYSKGVNALAMADFNRTKAASDRFQRSELRVMIRLLLAQAILRSQSNVPQTQGNN